MAADIDRITRDMADQADALAAEANSLKQQANTTMANAQQLADEHLQRAQAMASQILTEARTEANKLIDQAGVSRESAKHVREMVAAQRQAAELGPLEALVGDETQPDTSGWQPLVGQWVQASMSDGNTLYGTLAGWDDQAVFLARGDDQDHTRAPLHLVKSIEPVPGDAAAARPTMPASRKGGRS